MPIQAFIEFNGDFWHHSVLNPNASRVGCMLKVDLQWRNLGFPTNSYFI